MYNRLLPYLMVLLCSLFLLKLNDSIDYNRLLAIFGTNDELLSNVGAMSSEIQNISAKDQTGLKTPDEIVGAKYETLLTETDFSYSEVQLLQKLRKRREELNDRERDISITAGALALIQADIDQKLLKLKALQEEMSSSFGDQHDKEKLLHLVKVYENMKPKEAASVFDGLQPPFLADVAAYMKEQKLAQIIAEMTPEKARELTIALANRRITRKSTANQKN